MLKQLRVAHAWANVRSETMKRTSLSVSLFLIVAILGLASGCAKKLDDAKMASDIQEKFNQDSGLSGKQLTVQANDGTITLGGTVENDAQREAASRQAASEPGVKQVINNMQVGNVAASAAPVAAPKETSVAPPVSASKPSKPPKKPRKTRELEDQNMGNSGSGPADDSMANNAPVPAPSSAPETAPQTAPAPPPAPKKMIVDQGTQLTVRLVDAIDSEKNQSGDTFHATLNTPLTSDGEEVVPAGSDVVGHLAEVKSAGKFAGQSQVVLQLDSITSGGRTYNVQTDQYKKQGSSRGKNTAEKVGGGAAIGAIIGALAGGGKGAAIGAAAGGGVGGGVQAATKGQQIKLPSETVLTFTLQAPITVIQAVGPNSNRPRLGDSQ
jgi:hypothetical protein